MQIVVCKCSKENYSAAAGKYLDQLHKEKDITLFEELSGYYMCQGLVHELRLEDNQLLDVTYESWSKEEKNFVMNVLR